MTLDERMALAIKTLGIDPSKPVVTPVVIVEATENEEPDQVDNGTDRAIRLARRIRMASEGIDAS